MLMLQQNMPQFQMPSLNKVKDITIISKIPKLLFLVAQEYNNSLVFPPESTEMGFCVNGAISNGFVFRLESLTDLSISGIYHVDKLLGRANW